MTVWTPEALAAEKKRDLADVSLSHLVDTPALTSNLVPLQVKDVIKRLDEHSIRMYNLESMTRQMRTDCLVLANGLLLSRS